MTCSRCGLDNPGEMKFCGGCAAPLASICAKCGAENPPQFKFCGQCAAPLGAGSGSVPVPSASKATPASAAHAEALLRVTDSLDSLRDSMPEGERKTVTALFADIKGSMDLMEGLDPEEARAIVDPALRLMMDAAHRYGGHIVQSTGDGVFALFGAPVAHEDHPQRALYAALRMQEEMRRYADRLRAEGRTPLQMRVGVNTGEVVVRSIQTGEHAEYTPIGHCTGIAARMQALAPIGSIAVTEATQRLCAGYFALRLLGPARVKGVSELLNVYELTGLGALRTRLETGARRGLTRFVGREHELAQMRRLLELAHAGHGQMVAAMGEAGVGKSRLTYEFKALAGGDCLILEAYSVSYGKASAYLPVIEMLHGYFGIDSADDGRKRREKVIGKLLALDQSLQETLPYLFVLLGIQETEDPSDQMDLQTRRRRTQEALKRIVLRESLNQPLIVVFEDLHWVDGETQAWLDLLAGALANARVLLLVNYRPEYRHEWGNRSYYTQLRLDPLGSESAQELLSALLGDSAELAPLTRMIAERTEGNPFFIEEMVQALFDDGALVRNGAVKLTRPLAAIKVPATVQGILTSRIDRLPADQKDLLQTLAVMGREFSLALIRKVVNKGDNELERMLSDLQLGEFIYEQPALAEAEYIFKHALTLEVAYNTLLMGRRKQLHEHAAAAIEALYPERLDDHLNQLARHYSQSGNVRKAVKYLHLAGRQAAGRLAYEEAISRFTDALELLRSLPDDLERDRQELALRADLGPYVIATKGPGAEEVALIFTRARSLCEKLGEDVQLFWVTYALQFFHLLRLELEIGRELGERQLALAERFHDPSMLMAAYAALAETASNLGEFGTARDFCVKGIALDFVPGTFPFSEIGEPRTMLLAHSSRDLFILGYPTQALARSREALLAAHQSGPHAVAFALNLAAELHLNLGDERAARESTEALASLASDRGFLLWSAQAVYLRGQALVAEGQVEEGIAELCRGAASVEMTGAVAGIWKLSLAEAYGKIGRPDEGLAAIAQSLDLMNKTGLRYLEAELYRIRGELTLLEAPGAVGAAESALRQAVASARRQDAKSWELRAVTSLARLLASQGKRDEARATLAEIYNWFTEGFDTADLRNAKVLLDELA
jgi:class 3 adenylate cyclase/tetratricopeptide (TPR) repeat protein